MKRAFTVSAILLLAGWAASNGAKLVYTYDIWWHVAQGKWSLEHAAAMRQDVLSHTFAGKPLAYQEALGDVLVYMLASKFGLAAISIATALTALAVFILLYRSARTLGLAPYLSLPLCFIAFIPVRRFFNPEFAVFSIFFFTVFIACGLSYLLTKRRIFLWALVPLEFLWANTHRGAVVGPLIVLFLAVEIFTAERRRLPEAALAFVLTCAAALANPAGWGLFTSSFEVVTRFEMAQFTTYWQPLVPEYLIAGSPVLGILLTASIVSLVVQRKKMRPFEILTFLLAFLVCARGIRWAALPAIASVPLLSRAIKGSRVEHLSKKYSLHLAVLVLAGSAAAFAHGLLKQQPANGFGLAPWGYPERSASFVIAHRPEKNLYNSFNFGGFLAWRLFPHYPIFIDGRNESLYSFNFFKEAWEGEVSEETWNRLASRYEINTAIVEVLEGGDYFSFLDGNPDWRLVFLEERAAVFVRNIPQHRELIEKFSYKELPATFAVRKLVALSGDPERLRVFYDEAVRFVREAPDSPKAFHLAARACMRIEGPSNSTCEHFASEGRRLLDREFLKGRGLLAIIFGRE